jgi:outer membrane biosynthesis protein TonB
LFLALALSCLLHAAIVILPALGERSAPESAAARTPRSAQPVITLSLVLTRKGEKIPIPIPPTEGSIVLGDMKSPGAADSTAPESKDRSEGAGLLPIPGPVYYTTDQLTKRPQALAVAELDTAATRSIIVSGALILRLRINEQGQIVDAEVEQNELPEIFAETAIKAFRQSRFTPGERNGQRVNTLMRIEVRYDDKRLSGR